MRYRVTRYHGSSATSEPRFELVPLLDCTFQLLIFSLYFLIVTVHAKIMPIKLPTLETGITPENAQIAAVTVDRRGQFFLDQKPITRTALEQRLGELARQHKPPQFFLAIDTQPGELDRVPLMIELVETFRRLKIESFSIVGSGKTSSASDNQPQPTPTITK